MISPRGIVVAALLTAFAAGNAATAADASRTTPVDSVVATAKVREVAVYRRPGDRRPFRILQSPTENGGPLVFLVRHRAAGWEEVYLPTRPNGSTGWVRDRALDLSLDPYRVTVSLGAHLLTVTRDGRVIHREPAGVGRSIVPTPVGTYYIAELLKQPDPSGPYGPYAFGLSAHSNVLYSFGGGAGQIGIHGTNEPAALGTNVSHGCIRISNSGIATLARLLPLGTPVEIRR
jgi:lipoprotein-anchoring transpeptidase ErfK/SrfK